MLDVTLLAYKMWFCLSSYAAIRRSRWREQALRDGRELTWQDAKSQFQDTTGRTGPSTWAGGHYPEL